MKLPLRPYTVVTRVDNREVTHTVRATNADIAIRRAKTLRAENDDIGVRAVITVAAYPDDT